MLEPPVTAYAVAPRLPLMVAADLQDNLMSATHDLERLQSLLTDACDQLLAGFHGAIAEVETWCAAPSDAGARDTGLRSGLTRHLGTAITALQFQDMASQLVTHTSKRLRNCADRLASETMGDEGDDAWGPIVEDAPLRPNPVTQDEMDAGSIELF